MMCAENRNDVRSRQTSSRSSLTYARTPLQRETKYGRKKLGSRKNYNDGVFGGAHFGILRRYADTMLRHFVPRKGEYCFLPIKWFFFLFPNIPKLTSVRTRACITYYINIYIYTHTVYTQYMAYSTNNAREISNKNYRCNNEHILPVADLYDILSQHVL